jgi:hypothetical protein
LLVEEGVGPAPLFESGRLITWFGHDVEDGGPYLARILLDGFRTINTTLAGETTFFVPDSTFANLAPSNPHSVEVWVKDRAEFVSDSSLVFRFCLNDGTPCPLPTRQVSSRPTRRP